MFSASKSNLFSTPTNWNWNIKDPAKLKNLPVLTDKSRPALAGLLGGSLATMVLHPLDLLKTRQAVHGIGESKVARDRYSSVIKAIRSILKHEGGLKGLYSGVGANVVVSGTSWGIFFMSYGTIKSCLVENGKDNLDFDKQILAAAGAGITTTLITNPLAVVRTKLVMKSTKFGMLAQIKEIVNRNGFRGMYKGIIPSLLGVSHGTIQFVTYECIKQYASKNGYKSGTLETLAACSVSKLLAAILTYPFQNLRARQQASDQDVKLSKLSLRSIPGLYRGLTPYLMHVVPNVCMVFMMYELVVNSKGPER